MNKKIIVITTIVVVLLGGVGLYGYYTYLASQATQNTSEFGTTQNRGFFPFGLFGGGSNTETATTTESRPLRPEFIPRLRRVTSDPVAGAVFFNNASTSTSTLIYMDRSTGHIFETATSTLVVNRLSNTTVPAIQRALWAPDTSSIIVQSLGDDSETVRSFITSFAHGTTTELKGSFFGQSNEEFSFAPDGKSVFYIDQGDAVATGYIFDLVSGKRRAVFTSPLHEWRSSWATPTFITLTTKPSALAQGVAFRVIAKTGVSEKIVSGTTGLTTNTSPDGTALLYSTLSEGALSLHVRDLKKKSDSVAPLTTLPEKCVWGAVNSKTVYCAVPETLQGTLPDDWYQGGVSFSDSIWKIDLDSGATTKIFDTTDVVDGGVDATNLTLNKDETYLSFMNKKDSGLWLLRIKE